MDAVSSCSSEGGGSTSHLLVSPLEALPLHRRSSSSDAPAKPSAAVATTVKALADLDLAALSAPGPVPSHESASAVSSSSSEQGEIEVPDHDEQAAGEWGRLATPTLDSAYEAGTPIVWAASQQGAAVAWIVQERDYLAALHCHENVIQKRLHVLCGGQSSDENDDTKEDWVDTKSQDEEEWREIMRVSCESLQTLRCNLGCDNEDGGDALLQRALVMVDAPTTSAGQQVDMWVDVWLMIVHANMQHAAYDVVLDSMNAFLRSPLPTQKIVDGITLLTDVASMLEEAQDYERALAAVEDVLLAQSRIYGSSDLRVAQTLFLLATLMELTANSAGGKELRRAAHKMYATQLLQPLPSTNVILQRIPSMFAAQQYQPAVEYLTDCLQAAETVQASTSVTIDKSKMHFELGRAYIGLQDYVSATICLLEAKGKGIREEEIVTMLQHVDFLQRQPRDDEDTDPAEGPMTPEGRPRKHAGHILDAEGKEFGTPVTWEGVSVSGEYPVEADEVDDEEEATAYYDSAPSATPETTDTDDLSVSNLPAITVDAVPGFEDDAIEVTEVSHLLANSNHSDSNNESAIVSASSPSPAARRRLHRFRSGTKSPRRKGSKILADKFRRRKSSNTGFSSLVDEEATPTYTPPCEEDYHSQVTFDGPVQYINVSNSFESAVSQITLRMEDPDRHQEKEWWWGVNSGGLARWFPAVTQAVAAAEGFLSASAIHAQKKEVPDALAFLSEDEEEDEDGVLQVPTGVDRRESPNGSHANVYAKQNGSYAGQNDSWVGRGNASNAPRPGSVMSSNSRRGAVDVKTEIEGWRERLRNARLQKGASHTEVSTALFTLAVLHSRDQNGVSAVECASEALRIQKETGNMLDATRSLHFLADIHLHQKDCKLALSFYSDALRLESNEHGYYSDEVAKTLNCVGTVKSLQNEFGLAMESHQEALRILNVVRGEKHPLISDTLCQMGSVYYRERNSITAVKNSGNYTTFIERGMLEVIGRAHEDRGSYKMAISFFEEKLQFLESRAESEDALDEAATTLNSLGMLSTRAGLYSESIDYYERALSLQLQLGCDEVDLATARVLTGAVHCHLGQWSEAQRLLEDAFNVLSCELGTEHETVAATQFQMGIVYSLLFEEDVAAEKLDSALLTQQELLGADHPATLRTRREIIKLQSQHDGSPAVALSGFRDILKTQQDVHGPKHPNIADTLHCIGCIYIKQEDYSEALKILEECYYMRLEYLGWDHPLQASTLHEISKIHLARGRTKKALHICGEVLRIRTDVFNDKHIDVALTLATKGTCLLERGDVDGSCTSLTAALVMAVKAVGNMHPSVADLRCQVAALHLRKCEFDKAKEEVEMALQVFSEFGMAEENVKVKRAAAQLVRIERDELLCV